jgi:hypothetical protein
VGRRRLYPAARECTRGNECVVGRARSHYEQSLLHDQSCHDHLLPAAGIACRQHPARIFRTTAGETLAAHCTVVTHFGGARLRRAPFRAQRGELSEHRLHPPACSEMLAALAPPPSAVMARQSLAPPEVPTAGFKLYHYTLHRNFDSSHAFATVRALNS